MSWKSEFRHAIEQAPIKNVKRWKGWDTASWHGMTSWGHKSGRPVGLVLHHTAGASTESQSLDHSGNQCSADNGQASYVNRHPSYNSPCSQFTLRRCGQLDVHAYMPVYHCGKGSLKGTYWDSLGVPKDSGNRWLLGIEIVSRGKTDDLTEAQWATLSELIYAMANVCHWPKFESDPKLYIPRHKDYAPDRKVDIKAGHKKILNKLQEYGQLWDGKSPLMVDIVRQREEGIAGAAVHRLSQRLYDLGYWSKNSDVPERYVQKFPEKAWARYQADIAPGMDEELGGPGFHFYGHKGHDRVFQLPKGSTGPDGHLIDHSTDPAWHHEQ